jgi:hypothetical protein
VVVAVFHASRGAAVALGAGRPPALIVGAMRGREQDPLGGLRAAVAAVVGYIDESPERARIVLADCAGSEPLANARARALQTVSDLLLELARPYLRVPDDLGLRMTTLMAVGGFVELAAAWKDGRVDVDAATIAEHVADTAIRLAEQYIVVEQAAVEEDR